MINTIPGTNGASLPTDWDLIQAGLSDLDWQAAYARWITSHHGEAATLAWREAGCPSRMEPPTPPADQGVIRRSWKRGRFH